MVNSDNTAKEKIKPIVIEEFSELDVFSTEEMENAEFATFEELNPEFFATSYETDSYPDCILTDERIILKRLASIYRDYAGAKCMLDVGCGPVPTHIVSAAPWVEEIHMADYLQANIDRLSLWINNEPGARDWSSYIQYSLDMEGVSSNIGLLTREALIRQKVTKLSLCDLRASYPLGTKNTYSLVTCFYSTEQAARTEIEWFQVMANLGSLVESRGNLVCSFVRNADFYVVMKRLSEDKRDRVPVKIPIVPVNEQNVTKALRLNGFDPASIDIETHNCPGMESEGLCEIIIVRAQKK